MKNSIKKRGQKFVRRFSRVSQKAGEEGKEHIKENLIGRFSHIMNIRLLILEWSLLVIALILLATTQAFWFGESYAMTVFTTGGNYTEATLGEVNSMNPLFATTSSEKVLSRLMFSTIATIDYSGHPGIGLAKSITPSENGKIWTMKLRDGLKWSDGEPITNEDVLFTIGLIKNPAVNSIYDANLNSVNVSENENGEIVFELPTAYADFITALNIPVLPKHVLENVDPKNLVSDEFSNSPVTSGAFSFNAIQSGTSSDETIIYLSANPNYYKGKPMLSSFAIHTYPSKEKILDALNAGSVTATAELSDAEAESVNSKLFNLKDSSLNSGAFIFLNTGSKAMKDVVLRKAIRKGINLERIRAAAPETVPLDYPLIEAQIKLENYPSIPERNFEEAKQKIAEILGGEQLYVEIATINSGYLPNVAQAVAGELESLGLNVNVSTYEENQEFITNIVSKRSYDILVYEVELGADPDLLPYYHSSQASTTGLNLSNYKSVLADDLLLGARDTLDESLRVKKYETFLEYWVNDVPAIGLYRPNLAYYYNRNVRTYGNDLRLVTALDRFSDIDAWAVTKTTKNRTP